MKNSIVIKFIAVLLCAASLLGIAGSAVGIFVMTELDLFDKTVDQVRNERLQSTGSEFARQAALRYASQTLGGCSEEMLDNHYGNWFDGVYGAGNYRYTILDAEGKVLYASGEELTSTAGVYTYPITGQYLHMVSSETASEKAARIQAETASYAANFTIGEDLYVMDALPPEGSHVSYATFCDPYGNILYEAYHENGVGYLYYNYDGQVVFSGSRYEEDLDLMTHTIAGVYFQTLDGSVVYEASWKDGVGFVYYNNAGQLIFTSGAFDPALVSTPLEETIPEAEETLPAEEETEETPSSLLPVYYAAFFDEMEEKIYRVRGTGYSVGFLSVNSDGCLVYQGFQIEEKQLADDVTITGAYFCDPEDNRVFEVFGEDSVGTITYTDKNQLIFTSAAPATEFADAYLRAEAAEDAEESQAEETESSEETEATEETAAPQEHSSASSIPDETQVPANTEESTAATEAETVTEATEAAAVTEPTTAVETTAATEAPTEPDAAAEPAAARETILPTMINGKPLEEYHIETDEYYDHRMEEHTYVSYVRVPMPAYTVELTLAPGALGMDSEYQLLMMLRSVSSYLFPALGICLLVFAICAVYLCCAAGRRPGSDEVRANGLNCLPLDLYTGIAVTGIACCAAVGVEMGWDRLNQNFLFSCVLAVSMAFAACLILVAYCFAFAAQIKTPGGYWWRNSLCIRFILLFMRFGVWLEKFLSRAFFPFLVRAVKWLWNVVVLGFFRLWQRFADWFLKTTRRFFRRLYRWLHRFLSLLPVTWQWLLTGCVIIFIAALTLNSYNPGAVIFGLVVIIGILLYAAHCFGILSESAGRMSRGDLDTKVDDKLLLGCFKDFAVDLNELADVAVVAAQKQLKSERMKTELITNVSHDIKTPLTSIINYVDLLQKPHSPEEQEQYLEVLNRQSLRLKKLIDDLMDMSKANTGNMTVEITTVDAVESVNQALGEFADKLAAARLIPVFRHTEVSAAMRADGKLVWRVLSNVLSNAVKYAMPGTRLYIDLMELEGKVVISLKNISREELNVDAEELMERFVRGDDSRNTEGSGLGLNIAKSLMELQKGQLQLLVDGDLFKVTLIFPGA